MQHWWITILHTKLLIIVTIYLPCLVLCHTRSFYWIHLILTDPWKDLCPAFSMLDDGMQNLRLRCVAAQYENQYTCLSIANLDWSILYNDLPAPCLCYYHYATVNQLVKYKDYQAKYFLLMIFILCKTLIYNRF